MFTRFETTSGRLAVSAMEPQATVNASAAAGGKSRRNRMARTIGVSSNAAPSFANTAAIAAPRSTISGNSFRPSPPPQRATCRAAQAKKPASSRMSEMMMSATKVKVASQTMLQTVPTSPQPTTPVARATAAPPSADQPMPRPRGCQTTSTSVTTKIAKASMALPKASDRALVDAPGERFGGFDAFGVAVGQVGRAPTHEPGELHQLLAHVHNALVVGRRHHAACFVEFLERLGDGGLVRDGDNAHPAAQHAQL